MKRRAGEFYGIESGRPHVRWHLWCGVLLAVPALLAADVPSPVDVLGFDPTASGSVTSALDVSRYAHAVAEASDRAMVRAFGLSTDGAPLWMVLVSSPDHLSRWQELRRSGEKVFALVTCGIHPDEVGSTASFFPLLDRLVRARENALRELLDNMVVAVVPCMNPDGTDRVASWLQREGRSAESMPVLYHRYAGHDLNRDWLLATQAETRSLIRRVHHVFVPWITIDLHQMGRLGPRLFVPPYAEPMDPTVSWDIRAHLESLGDQVFDSLARQGQEGIVRRWVYDGWTPARAYPSYHGGMRFLLEAASARYAHPLDVRESDLWIFGAGNQSTANHPRPWKGGRWELARITDLLVEATVTTLLALLEDPLRTGQREHFRRVLLEDDGVLLDGRGGDPGVAQTLLRRLAQTGVRITAGTEPSTWILRDPAWGAGWCRSLLLCTPYPSPGGRDGASLEEGAFNATPYDTSTHNLTRLSGLHARTWEAPPESDARKERARDLAAQLGGRTPPLAVPPLVPGRRIDSVGSKDGASWLISQRSLATFKHLPDLIETGARVERLSKADLALGARAGDFLIDGVHPNWIDRLVEEGADATRLEPGRTDTLSSVPLRYPRHLWVLQGARPSMDEGWLRWVLETFRFRFRTISVEELVIDRDFGRRRSPQEWGRPVLLLPEGSLRRPDPRLQPILDELVERGGRIIALGRATRWAAHTCHLPVTERALDAAALPGTILRTLVSTPEGFRDPTLWGYNSAPDVFYQRGPLWDPPPVLPGTSTTQPLLAIPTQRPLVCGLLAPGYAARVSGAAALIRIRHSNSNGEWLLCGFRPHFRGWTLGTFRLLFNMVLAP